MRARNCKPISLCSSLLPPDKRKKRRSASELEAVVEPRAMPSLLKYLENARKGDSGLDVLKSTQPKGRSRSSDLPSRQHVSGGSKGTCQLFTHHDSLPSLEAAYASFREAYPKYLETATIDKLRAEEYGHLQEDRVCLDYCGFGLFSQLQQMQHWESASFALADISVNLYSHALFGAAEEGSVEFDIRRRIMDYLNIPDAEYSMIFTASRGATFRLLADVYPFESCRQLITMYDFESESVGWMVQKAKEKGAKIRSAHFKWPSLRICSTDLKRQLLARRRRKDAVKGLFAFPVVSRVSGAKYSYQWMSLAQQNKWHVLLDASALGPKDMDALGLSLFRPDFVIASFYKVFGADPSGFGCLFIKNSTIQFIHDSSGAPASGIVRIIPFPPEWLLSESSEGLSEEVDQFQDLKEDGLNAQGMKVNLTSVVSSFSGPMLSCKRHLISDKGNSALHCFEEDVEEIEEENSSPYEQSEYVSAGEVTRSPVFSDDSTDNLFCIDIGPSPIATVSCSSMSEEPLSGPICHPVYDEELLSPIGQTYAPVIAREGCMVLSEGEARKDAVSRPAGGMSTHITAEGHLGSTKETERFEAHFRSRNNKNSCIQLLDTGTSPFIETNGRIEGECKKGFDYPLQKVEQQKAHSNVSESPETGGSSGKTGQGRLVDIGNGKTNRREMENLSAKSLDTISEICSSCDSHQIISQSDDQRAKEEQSPIPWSQRENAIRRETEGDFRLLGRWNGDLARSLPVSMNGCESMLFAEGIRFGSRESNEYLFQEDEGSASSDEDENVDELWIEREPEVFCKCLDHADTLGLNKTSFRLRCLINWLINSLLQLRHPISEKNSFLVHIYGPHVRFDRGASVAFNLYDCHGRLLSPDLVQMVADKNKISLGIGFLRNIRFSETHLDACIDMKISKNGRRRRMPYRIEVVTAALSLLSNFEDVYRVWIFVGRFLDADFVSREIALTS